MDNLLSSRASQTTKLRDRLKLEKPNMSCTDLDSEVTKNVDNIPPASSGNHQKQKVKKKAIENEELVKYMSNLPSYLEKGENLKEKALNVGVLDWRRLEKWQYSHKPISHQSSRCSPSSSNTSSFFSTEGSSNHSSRGHSCSPARQRMHRVTLQSHLNASPKEGYSQGVEAAVPNVEKFRDLKAVSNNPLKGQESIFRMYRFFSKNQSEVKLEECKRKDAEQQIIPEIENSLHLKDYGAASLSKGKTKIQGGESTSGQEELQESYGDDNHNYRERCKTVVPLPVDDPECSHTAISCPYDLETVNSQRSMEASRRRFSEGSFPKELYNADFYSDIPLSCPLPCEDENIKDSQTKQPNSTEAKSVKFSSEPCSAKMSISSSRVKNLVEKKSEVMPTSSTATKSSKGSDLKKDTVEASKSRNPSSTHRFSIGLGRIGRTSSSKDSSEHFTAKCGSEKTAAFSCLEDSGNDKPNGTSRSQSSPLRRLLDPLLKPKAPSSHDLSEPSEKDPASADRACKSSNGRVESSTVHSVKVKLDLTSCKTINIDDSHHKKKNGSSPVQALFQIAIKNGLPLFTFAVGNNSDILAATMRKVSASRKDDNCWIYTFFTVHEVKKKNGWINQGGRGKSHGYVPNIVAQMTVSDSQFSNLVRHNSANELSIREFVLFAVDKRQGDQHASELQPNDELAAIVVKFPKGNPRNLNKDGQHSDYSSDPSAVGVGESLSEEVGCYPNSRENEENGSSVCSQDHHSTTVILPGGVHGLPSKGEPSPLITRWISGGLCDCGGWDLGCRLTVLGNQTKLSRRSSSSKTHHTADRFELFSQGEVLDDRPVFSMSPFKDRIFSVEFKSSLSLPQAFSICIAVLNSRKPYELSELSKLSEEKSSEETAVLVNDGIKAPQVQPEVPGSHASYPPLSPVGRV